MWRKNREKKKKTVMQKLALLPGSKKVVGLNPACARSVCVGVEVEISISETKLVNFCTFDSTTLVA